MRDRDFFNWLAGFIDGEGCFYITRDSARGVYRARFSLTLRSDDRPILEEIHHRTQIGTLHNYMAQSGNQVTRWMVQSRPDCALLSSLLIEHPLRAKKAKDFEVWVRAVEIQDKIRSGRADNSVVRKEMEDLKTELAAVRVEGVVHV